ncbi:MAG TPA: glycosyltransferase family 39 protein [Solirubrobacterales bacterium]|nr:glycosyltransferase family 39 protein [Solirubrobacterales bacterium]
MESATQPRSPSTWSLPRLRDRVGSLPLPRPELAALLVLAGLLNLWALGQNGWANEYYSAAVRSMSGSWHNFLFGSFDAQGLMTVDKPPLALWVQALSVKAFGFNSLAILVPQALMGVASVALLYDLVRRRFGREAGFVAGLVLALTPIAVAVSRHNNPDALLVLCCVAALWAFVRALEDGRTRWLVLAGVCVGLGFETKMGVALMVVPGIALAWLWVAPRGRAAALRQLLAAGGAMVAVGLAWPLLVELTPASGRPWVAGTTDNSVFSLILEYNGFGRLDGQAGGPGAFGGGGGPFGGSTGPLRLLNEALGGQAGWLLGMALAGAIGIALLSRLRRDDERTGWLIAVGGSFAVIAVAFSFASGIFHPYYVSLLAPFSAALIGATWAQARSQGSRGRLLGAVALGAGAITELIVIGNSAGDLSWLVPAIVIVTVVAVIGLTWTEAPAQLRRWALVAGVGVLLVGPAIWSVETLGHPTSGTFPAGGPESASMMGGPGGGAMPGMGSGEGMPGGEGGTMPGFGSNEMVPGGGGMPEGLQALPGMGEGLEGAMPGIGEGGFSEGGALPGGSGEGAFPEAGTLGQAGALPGAGGTAGAGAGGFGGADLSSVLAYTESHGGGTIAVESQSEAAASIIESGAEVAGIGGFSGKETSVSVRWLEERIESGQIRWILSGGGMTGALGTGAGAIGGGQTMGPGAARGGLPGDTRSGSESAIETVVKTCTAVESSQLETSAGTLYDCQR